MKAVVALCVVFLTIQTIFAQNGCQQMSQCLDNANKQFEVCHNLAEQVEDRIATRGRNNQNNPCKAEVSAMKLEIGKLRRTQSQERQECMARRSANAQPTRNTCSNENIPSVVDFQLPEINGAQRNVRRQMRETIRECKQKSRGMTKQCKKMVDCCSESKACHLEFELSKVHDDIRRVKLNILDKKRDCGLKGNKEVNRDQIFEGETY